MSRSAFDFFSALTSSYPSYDEQTGEVFEHRLEIRCLPPQWSDRPTPYPRQWFCLEPEYLHNAEAFCNVWRCDWDCYMGVLPRRGRTGTQNRTDQSAVLFADVDGGDEGIPGAIRLIKAAPIPKPHVAIQSGGGVHSYWFLSSAILFPDHAARETFKMTLRRLCRLIGGSSPNAHADTAACEVARVLRVPGTFNHKIEGQPRPVKCLRFAAEEPRFSYDWWRSVLPLEPVTAIKPSYTASAYTDAGFISDGLIAWSRRGYSEGKRHQDLTGCAAWLVRDCKLNKSDAAFLLREKVKHSPGRRTITDREVEQMIAWA